MTLVEDRVDDSGRDAEVGAFTSAQPAPEVGEQGQFPILPSDRIAGAALWTGSFAGDAVVVATRCAA